METQPFTQNTFLARHLHALTRHTYCLCKECDAYNKAIQSEKNAKTAHLRAEREAKKTALKQANQHATTAILDALDGMDNKDKRALLRALAEDIGR